MMGRALTVLVIIVVLAVIGIAAYVLLDTPLLASLANQSTSQKNVLVSGVIKTGITTSPLGINFTSEKTGQSSYTTIDKNGYYSIALLGNDTYNVTIYYNTLFGTSTNKNCRAVLVFNGMVTAYNFSRNC
jgi:hypothetical protein